MNTFALPTSVDTNPANEAIRNFHFSVAQIREIGLDHGVSEGVLARRMKDLTEGERQLLRSKYSDEVLRILAEKSFEIGKGIVVYADKIDDMTDAIDSAIQDLEGLEPAEQHKDRLNDLKDDRRALRKQRQELDNIERQRMSATPENIDEVEAQFSGFRERFDTFAERFRNRSYSNRFDINSMGLRGNDDDDNQPRRRRGHAPDNNADHDPSADAA